MQTIILCSCLIASGLCGVVLSVMAKCAREEANFWEKHYKQLDSDAKHESHLHSCTRAELTTLKRKLAELLKDSCK